MILNCLVISISIHHHYIDDNDANKKTFRIYGLSGRSVRTSWIAAYILAQELDNHLISFTFIICFSIVINPTMFWNTIPKKIPIVQICIVPKFSTQPLLDLLHANIDLSIQRAVINYIAIHIYTSILQDSIISLYLSNYNGDKAFRISYQVMKY